MTEGRDEDEWRKRHDQPDLIEETGIRYRRGTRWKLTEDQKYYHMAVGWGDEPDSSLPEIEDYVRLALWDIVGFAHAVVETYCEILKSKGIRSRDTNNVSAGNSERTVPPGMEWTEDDTRRLMEFLEWIKRNRKSDPGSLSD